MSWWAAYSEPGRALLARDELSAAGFDALCPVEWLTKRRKVPNRNQYRPERTLVPVFGRYLFVEGEPADLLRVRGVQDMVRGGASGGGVSPLSVPERVVDKLRGLTQFIENVGHLMGSRDLARLSLDFHGKVGDAFQFRAGAFQGFVGLIRALDRLDTSGEVEVEVDLLGGARRVFVPCSMVGPIVGLGAGAAVGEMAIG
jgi:transcription antitermination factor NusG